LRINTDQLEHCQTWPGLSAPVLILGKTGPYP